MMQPNSASWGTPPGGDPVLEICVPFGWHIEFDTIGGLTYRVFNPTPTLLASLRAAIAAAEGRVP